MTVTFATGIPWDARNGHLTWSLGLASCSVGPVKGPLLYQMHIAVIYLTSDLHLISPQS